MANAIEFTKEELELIYEYAEALSNIYDNPTAERIKSKAGWELNRINLGDD